MKGTDMSINSFAYRRAARAAFLIVVVAGAVRAQSSAPARVAASAVGPLAAVSVAFT